jgi:hypothetical protein
MAFKFSKRKLGLLLAAIAFSAFWFIAVGWADRGEMVRDAGLSMECHSEHLPKGTIHNPEGSPHLPRGEYRFFPILGLECTFSMIDGTEVQTFYPNYAFTTMAALPMFITAATGTRWLIASGRLKGNST